MQEKREDNIENIEEQHIDESDSTAEIERPKSGLKLRTHIKAGLRLTMCTIDAAEN